MQGNKWIKQLVDCYTLLKCWEYIEPRFNDLRYLAIVWQTNCATTFGDFWHILTLCFWDITTKIWHILKFLNIYWSEEKIVYCAFHGQFGQHFLLRQVDPEIPGKWVWLRKMGAGHSTEKVQKVPKWADIPLVLRNWEVRTDATRAGATGQHQQYSLHLLLERSRNVVIRRRLKF